MPATTTDAFLGIDLGTSSVKVVLMGEEGQELSRAEAPYDVSHRHPGWAETDPADWLRATTDAMQQALAGAAGVTPVGVGLSGQMHGVVATAPDGSAARPAVLWADSRAEDELHRYRALPETPRRALANPLSPGMAGPILGWVRRHEPRVADTTRWNLQPKDWLRLQLTGEACAEPSDASATLLYDVDADTWCDSVVDALEADRTTLAEILPSSGTVAGHLTPGLAAALGLPAGLPVAAGAADTAAAMLGGALMTPGTAQLTIGTGLQIVAPTGTAPTALDRVDPVTHYYRAATDHGHYRMAAVLGGGLALGWVCRVLGASWSQLYDAASTPVADDAPFFLPHLSGERTPYMDSSLRGAWTGLTAHHERDDLLRSALEGVAFAAAEANAALQRAGAESGALRLAGGGSTSPAWRQMLADVLGVDLAVSPVSGASARGAAYLGARAAGRMDEESWAVLAAPVVTEVVAPRYAATERHRQRLGRWRGHVDRLRLRPDLS